MASLAINPYSEAVLYTSSSSRDKWDNSANLYSLILSIDALERAYVSQAVSDAQYAPTCSRLLAQAKTSIKLVTGAGVAHPDDPPSVKDLDEFMKLWDVSVRQERSWLESRRGTYVHTSRHSPFRSCPSHSSSSTCLSHHIASPSVFQPPSSIPAAAPPPPRASPPPTGPRM